MSHILIPSPHLEISKGVFHKALYSSEQKFRSPSCKISVHLSLTQRLIHPADTLPHRSDKSPIKTRSLHGINKFWMNWGESGKIILYSK